MKKTAIVAKATPASATGLLVSVASLAEALTVAPLEVAIVDVKDPTQGALGAADPQMWHDIERALKPSVCLSAALGEATQATQMEQLPSRFRFAKAGPAGCQQLVDLQRHWDRIKSQLPPSVEFVAVAYADHLQGQCPSPEAILSAAAKAGLRWWLLDTFQKDGRSTLQHLGIKRLLALDQAAREADMQWVLAGSLRLEDLPNPLLLRPRYVGLRGDVCEHGRTGQISATRVKQWSDHLRSEFGN